VYFLLEVIITPSNKPSLKLYILVVIYVNFDMFYEDNICLQVFFFLDKKL